ncbi:MULTISPECIES: 4-oxalocrotonate tautomerase family protein [Streptomycetaceae]|uniref:4-oxalocrotonate tautomerase family protein n=1 Tax=Streptomycetaceae TaxID=2062 RepID=UPI00300B6163
MPFANFKVPAGTLEPAQKQLIVDRVTDLYSEIYGDRARQNTMVLVEEVPDGGWGIGGTVLTSAMINGNEDGDGAEAGDGAGAPADRK